MSKTPDFVSVCRRLNGSELKPKAALKLAADLFDLKLYNLAALVAYRAIDLAVSHFLNERVPFTSWDEQPYRDNAASFLSLKQQLFAPTPVKELPWRLSFSDQCLVLHIFYPQLLTRDKLRQVIECAATRHECWLAHGTKRVTYYNARKLNKIAFNLVTRIIEQ